MMKSRKNGGFTLVELIVTIAVGSVITLAATTVLLLGLRVNNQSTETVQNQNTTRILLSALEDMASEGTITKIEYSNNDWTIQGKNGPVFSYDSDAQIIYTGSVPDDKQETTTAGIPLMEGVISSFVTWGDNDLLTFTVETSEGTFTSSVYYRLGDKNTESKETGKTGSDTDSDQWITDGKYTGEIESALASELKAREEFLTILAGQYKIVGTANGSKSDNNGVILKNGYSTGKYYSQWYSSNWSKDTPWCACFVSWALSEVEKADFIDHPAGRSKWYANVDRFAEYFTEINQWEHSTYKGGDYTPIPGDLIFFDWDGDNDLQHVGVVLSVSGDKIYTIEGNSGNKVAVREYDLTKKEDYECIAGYGILPWKTPDETAG